MIRKMKRYICLLFLFFNYYGCLENESNWLTTFKRNDVDDYAERPCLNNDMNCIRRYFAQHSHCNVTHGPTPDPFILERAILPHAIPNITFILNHAKVTGTNGKVTEFTINKKTNNLVIAVEVTNLTIISPRTDLRYYRKAKEPIVLTDKAMVTFASITFTAIIPNIDKLEISELDVFSYIEDDNPVYLIGSGASSSLDDDVIRSFNKLVRNIPDIIKETLLILGPVFTFNFIQYNICDFGYKISV